MSSSTIDGQRRIDWIQQNLLSTVAAVSGWTQFSSVCLKHDESWSAALARPQSDDTDAESHLSAVFPVSSPWWVAELVEWWFEMSGFRSGWAQRARWDALWEKSNRTTHNRPHPSHREPQGWPKWNSTRTQSPCCLSRWTDCFHVWSFQSVIYWSGFFPVEFGLCTGLMQWLFEASGF